MALFYGAVLTPSIEPDVHLVSNDKKSHPAHWVALVACGDHFGVMRKSGMKEAIENEIHADAEDETIDAFLHWAYFEEYTEKLAWWYEVQLLLLSKLWQLNNLERTIKLQMQKYCDSDILWSIAFSLKLGSQATAEELIDELSSRKRTKALSIPSDTIDEIETEVGNPDGNIGLKLFLAAICNQSKSMKIPKKSDKKFSHADLDNAANFTIKGKEGSQIRVYRPVLLAASPHLRSTIGAEQTSLDCVGDQHTQTMAALSWRIANIGIERHATFVLGCFSVGHCGDDGNLETGVRTRSFSGDEVFALFVANRNNRKCLVRDEGLQPIEPEPELN